MNVLSTPRPATAGRQQVAGFTLIEIVIAIAVIAILAGIATPSIVKNIRDSRIAQAKTDTQKIASTIASFYKDVGRWPSTDGTDDLVYLASEMGAMPTASTGVTGWIGNVDTFTDQLIDNGPSYSTTGEFAWRGPYQTEFGSDPWGRKFLCSVGRLSAGSTTPVYVLSAGPDGIVQTDVAALLAGDDVGFRIQ
jgi:prepilin-type N-terminal cleavage/methylation domain-containing protein